MKLGSGTMPNIDVVARFVSPLEADEHVRNRFLMMEQDELVRRLAEANLNCEAILFRVTEKAAALDSYVASIDPGDFSSGVLRRKIRSLAVMGGVPFLIGMATLALLLSGDVTSKNGQIFAGVVLIGSGLVVLLSLISVVHVALKAALHAQLKETEAKKSCSMFAEATIELYGRDSLLGSQVLEHFRRYAQLRRFF